MDKSLDDIIKSKPRATRGRGGPRRSSTARQQILGKTATKSPVNRARRVSAPGATLPAVATSPPADKIIVSNLPMDVNEAQVKELFHTTVGPLREVTLHYDANGKSKGIATVLFSRKGDGTAAYNQYNNRLIDGKRPMKIEVVVDPARPVQSSLVSRVAPAANGAAAPMEGVQRNGARPQRRKKTKRPQKSVADLDAEMEDYSATNAPAAAAPATAAAA